MEFSLRKEVVAILLAAGWLSVGCGNSAGTERDVSGADGASDAGAGSQVHRIDGTADAHAYDLYERSRRALRALRLGAEDCVEQAPDARANVSAGLPARRPPVRAVCIGRAAGRAERSTREWLRCLVGIYEAGLRCLEESCADTRGCLARVRRARGRCDATLPDSVRRVLTGCDAGG